ncbi:MAG TPA: pyridoxine 5'-phosphate synthase [Planctomycetes bacterium]|nr:pyridoxine 5'-phosphate synthase [Planctomycetota bacterium]
MARLFVNVDHVATLREARGVDYPSPVAAALRAEQAGAAGITVHLREDRRHIQDADLRTLKQKVRTTLNMELSVSEEIVAICRETHPEQATLVPEHREELTTEGGLDLRTHMDRIRAVVDELTSDGILVSLFIDPDPEAVSLARMAGARLVELHTGAYANASSDSARSRQLEKLCQAAAEAQSLGLVVNAGHGLTYDNLEPIAAIPEMNDLNIGHALIADALDLGLFEAVQRMRNLIEQASPVG